MQVDLNRHSHLKCIKESDRKTCERFMHQEENKCDHRDEAKGKRKEAF